MSTQYERGGGLLVVALARLLPALLLQAGDRLVSPLAFRGVCALRRPLLLRALREASLRERPQGWEHACPAAPLLLPTRGALNMSAARARAG